MIINDDAVLDFKIYYLQKNRKYDAYTEKEFNDLQIDNKDKFSVLMVKMKELTWGLYNELQEHAMIDDGKGFGNRYFNFKLYKENRLRKLLVGWDAKDKEGKIIPINDSVVCKLAPSIAEAMLRAYDEESYLSEGEEKNL